MQGGEESETWTWWSEKKKTSTITLLFAYTYIRQVSRKKKKEDSYLQRWISHFFYFLPLVVVVVFFFFCFPPLYWRGHFESALKKKNKRDLNDNNTVFFFCVVVVRRRRACCPTVIFAILKNARTTNRLLWTVVDSHSDMPQPRFLFKPRSSIRSKPTAPLLKRSTTLSVQKRKKEERVTAADTTWKKKVSTSVRRARWIEPVALTMRTHAIARNQADLLPVLHKHRACCLRGVDACAVLRRGGHRVDRGDAELLRGEAQNRRQWCLLRNADHAERLTALRGENHAEGDLIAARRRCSRMLVCRAHREFKQEKTAVTRQPKAQTREQSAANEAR